VPVKLYSCESDSKWDEFQNASPHGSIYSQTRFLSALNIPCEKLFLDVNDKIVASALVIEPGNDSFRAPFPASMYQGLSLAPMLGKRHSVVTKNLQAATLMIEMLSRRYNTLEFCLHREFNDIRPLQWFNYHSPESDQFGIKLKYTGIIQFESYKDFDSYFQSIRTVRRQEYRKAEKAGLEVMESDNISEFIRLYELTFRRQGVNLEKSKLERVIRISETAISSGFGRLTLCGDARSNVHAGILTLQDNNCTYYQFSATDPEFRSSGASTCLLLHNIRHSMESGKNTFDMVGINSPNRGDYKVSFNALPTPYFIASWRNRIKHPLL